MRAKLEEAAERKRRQAQKRQAASEGEPSSVPTGPAPTPPGSLPNEGTERVAPDVPTAKGGDNSIQEFGVEGPSGERVQAARTLQAYLRARFAGEWAQACSYLSPGVKKGLEQLGGQAQADGQRDEDARPLGCAQLMRALTEGVPERALRDAAQVRVLSMRVEDEQAFLLYRNGEGKPSAIPMADEDGQWKVAALDGSPLLLSVDSL